jgi:hypothetical protein
MSAAVMTLAFDSRAGTVFSKDIRQMDFSREGRG